jgi:hypothetical protein
VRVATHTCPPDRKGLIKIISTRYFLVIKEINKYLVDMILINKIFYFRSGCGIMVTYAYGYNAIRDNKEGLTFMASYYKKCKTYTVAVSHRYRNNSNLS